MRVFHSVTLILVVFFSAVNAGAPVRVVATIPDDNLQENVAKNSSEGVRPMKDIEVTGFISKDGDIFELSEPRSIGSIESRQEPPPKSETTMCRYGNIVVYSDADCNTLVKPPPSPEELAKVEQKKEVKQKPRRRNKGGIRKASKNKRANMKHIKQINARKQTNKQSNQIRRNPGKKQGVTTNRRRNNLNQKAKRRKNQQKKNKQGNQRRGTNNNNKRKRINNSQTRSHEEPMRFAVLYDRT